MGESPTVPSGRGEPSAAPARRSVLELREELREVQFVRGLLYFSVLVSLLSLGVLAYDPTSSTLESPLTPWRFVALAVPAGLVLFGLQVLDRYGAWVVGGVALWLTVVVLLRAVTDEEARSWSSLLVPGLYVLALWATTAPAASVSRQVREDPNGFVAQWLAGGDGEGLGPRQREALASRGRVHRAERRVRWALGAALIVLVVLGVQRLG